MIGGEEDFYFSCVLKEEEWCLYNNHNKTKETPYFLGQMNPITRYWEPTCSCSRMHTNFQSYKNTNLLDF